MWSKLRRDANGKISCADTKQLLSALAMIIQSSQDYFDRTGWCSFSFVYGDIYFVLNVWYTLCLQNSRQGFIDRGRNVALSAREYQRRSWINASSSHYADLSCCFKLTRGDFLMTVFICSIFAWSSWPQASSKPLRAARGPSLKNHSIAFQYDKAPETPSSSICCRAT